MWLRFAILGLAAGLSLSRAQSPNRFDVRAFGAQGDGEAIDSPAINRAIEAARDAGGGIVTLPAGHYRSFSLRLQSDVTLQLEAGAVLIAADPPENLSTGYDAPEPNPENDRYQDFGHSHWHNSLIWGEDLENVAILGPGRIYGFGLSRERNRRDLTVAEAKLPASQRPSVAFGPELAARLARETQPGPFGFPMVRENLPPGVGNKSIALKNCRHVVLRDLTIEHGGNYAVLFTGVDNAVIDGLLVDTNRDGIDLDSCRNVRVTNTSINAPFDDALVLKTSHALGRPRVTENITIANCILTGFDEGTVLDGSRQRKIEVRKEGNIGRFKIGTESNGTFRNIVVNNLVFEHSRGLTIGVVDGGALEDVLISNLTMRHIAGAPIFLRLGARLRGPAGAEVSPFRRVRISNVIASDVTATSGIFVGGLARQPIEDLTLENIGIQFAGGGTLEQAARRVEDLDTMYPEPAYWGVMPSWGIWMRHVKGVTLAGVTLAVVRPDLRPAVVIEQASEIALWRVEGHSAAEKNLILRAVRDVQVRDSRTLVPCEPNRIVEEKIL